MHACGYRHGDRGDDGDCERGELFERTHGCEYPRSNQKASVGVGGNDEDVSEVAKRVKSQTPIRESVNGDPCACTHRDHHHHHHRLRLHSHSHPTLGAN